ncbi:hypothetical protein BDP55DRAFT_642553 [Colletotrichum godetiae]|uniref:Uncharacterized protein n=1 Tax=Colletotrichum godetiae TaxID=1209918 RepID=A0AAJ0F4C8_9PEZI|nr:uncharacterized protein BDP55DRAFT_642553 [Colletotrichum godetiae]KAK1700336.1 hypothetical protein BDP55DRAFT_642553 [Colletotrichum godetiae]
MKSGEAQPRSTRIWNPGKVRTYWTVLYCLCFLSWCPTIVSSFNFFLPLPLFFFYFNVYFATSVWMAWDVHFGMQCSRYQRLLRGLVCGPRVLFSAYTACNWHTIFLLFILSFSRRQVPGVDSVSRMWTPGRK